MIYVYMYNKYIYTEILEEGQGSPGSVGLLTKAIYELLLAGGAGITNYVRI